jgi:hypothetical protein
VQCTGRFEDRFKPAKSETLRWPTPISFCRASLNTSRSVFIDALLVTLQPKLRNEPISTENNGFRRQSNRCVKRVSAKANRRVAELLVKCSPPTERVQQSLAVRRIECCRPDRAYPFDCLSYKRPVASESTRRRDRFCLGRGTVNQNWPLSYDMAVAKNLGFRTTAQTTLKITRASWSVFGKRMACIGNAFTQEIFRIAQSLTDHGTNILRRLTTRRGCLFGPASRPAQ